jgi:riboflavin kinase / FMN adenylyltransferase
MAEDRIVCGLDEVPPAPSVVSIGFFDGVHRGHQTIIRRATRQAHDAGIRSAVVTFDRHPMEVVRPGSEPPLLMTPERRARRLAAQDVDLVVVLPFDDDLRHLAPDAFARHVLSGPLAARHVIVGANFRFGHRASGDVTTLADLAPLLGFRAEGVSLLEIDGVVISSTEIRTRIEAGDVVGAQAMLGRPHAVEGIVVRGDGRGASIGFPTANIQVNPRIVVPAQGVYAGHCRLPDGREHACVTNVGTSPTFGGHALRVETHLLGIHEDLYGHEVSVEFRHRLRAERRFDGPQALVAQIRSDVDAARALLG